VPHALERPKPKINRVAVLKLGDRIESQRFQARPGVVIRQQHPPSCLLGISDAPLLQVQGHPRSGRLSTLAPRVHPPTGLGRRERGNVDEPR
jgi:hypothetical protein